MSDHYCFICGHYLSDAYALNPKNKKIYVGDHQGGNHFLRKDPNGENVTYELKKEDILYHIECYEVLSKDCKYKLSYKDIQDNIEHPNRHELVPYDNIERPPHAEDIRKEHKWSKDQIIEEWTPVIDEIRTKNTELKAEKKQALQLKREVKREQLRSQRDKKTEKINAIKIKLEKLTVSLESEQKVVNDKQTLLQTTKDNSKRDKISKQLTKAREKVTKKEEAVEKENDKLEKSQQEYDLFLKAWF